MAIGATQHSNWVRELSHILVMAGVVSLLPVLIVGIANGVAIASGGSGWISWSWSTFQLIPNGTITTATITTTVTTTTTNAGGTWLTTTTTTTVTTTTENPVGSGFTAFGGEILSVMMWVGILACIVGGVIVVIKSRVS
jgi:hypothetical protein